MRFSMSQSRRARRGFRPALLRLVASCIFGAVASSACLDAVVPIPWSPLVGLIERPQSFSLQPDRMHEMSRNQILPPAGPRPPLFADRPRTRPDQIAPQNSGDNVNVPSVLGSDGGAMSPVPAHAREIDPTPELHPAPAACCSGFGSAGDAPVTVSQVADWPGTRPDEEKALLGDRPGTRPRAGPPAADRPGTRPDEMERE